MSKLNKGEYDKYATPAFGPLAFGLDVTMGLMGVGLGIAKPVVVGAGRGTLFLARHAAAVTRRRAAKPSPVQAPEPAQEPVPMNGPLTDDVASTVETITGNGFEARLRAYANGLHIATVHVTTKRIAKKLGRTRFSFIEHGPAASATLKQRIRSLIEGTVSATPSASQARARRAATANPSTAPAAQNGGSTAASESKAGTLEKRGDSVKGVLTAFGRDERTTDSGSFTQYFADLEIDGATHRLWGADLERAIKEANATHGMTVQVTHQGRISTGKGNNKYKNLYKVVQS